MTEESSIARTGALDAKRKRVGVIFHRRVEESRRLGQDLVDTLNAMGAEAGLIDGWMERRQLMPALTELDWAIVLGGDGTVLRLAGMLAPHDIPLIGVNFGRLGFLTELNPEEASEGVKRILFGEGERYGRLMLRADCADGFVRIMDDEADHETSHDAVNDVFIGRGRVAHAVRMEVAIDGRPLIQFAADGLLVSTPTGSTAYSLSAGGPVVSPEMDALVLTPVVPHPVPVRTMILPADSRVDVKVRTEEEAICSIDGQRHYGVPDGETVCVQASPHRARFLRLGSKEQFYQTLVERLRRW